MKKLLLSSMIALALSAAAVKAGPVLDALVSALSPGSRVSFSSERSENGAEIYEALEVSTGATTLRFDQVVLRLEGNSLILSGNGVSKVEGAGSSIEIGNLQLSAPRNLAAADLWALLSGADDLDDKYCEMLVEPFSLDVSGIRISNEHQVDSLSLDMSAEPVLGVCVLDFDQSATGIDLAPYPGSRLRIEEQTLRGRTRTLAGLPEVETGQVFSSEMILKKAEFFIGGARQARIAEAVSRLSFDADTGLLLVQAGYNRHLEALTMGLVNGRSPKEQLPYADLWNAARALNTESLVKVSGLEVVGRGLSSFSPVPGLLDEGARLDFEMIGKKSAEILEVSIRADGSNTIFLEVGGSLKIEEVDTSFNDLSPRVLLVAAPLSFVSGSIRFSDRGIGTAVEHILGLDPYMMIMPALGGTIGAGNAQTLSDWVSGARGGGEARISARPAQPVPILTLGMMGLDDWSALGAMLNVSRQD